MIQRCLEENVNNIPKEHERWRKMDLEQHISEVARGQVPHAAAERDLCGLGSNDYAVVRGE